MSGARVGVVVLAGLVGAAISLGVSAPAASATDVPLSFEMHTLLPGETRSVEGDVEVPIRSTVATASFEATGADAAWSALLCASGGSCTEVAALEGTVLDAGTYRIVVDVTTPDDFALGGTASAEGVLRLAQVSDDGLAVTGGTAPWLAGTVGAALAAAGAILLIAGRRRREDARA